MDALKAELSKLQQQRAALEAEINERSGRLNAPGQPGMQESLIDKEVGVHLLCVFGLPLGICAPTTSTICHHTRHQTYPINPCAAMLMPQGFPRADIDVHAVRIDRNAVIRLTNDHKAVSQQMEQLLHKLHALAR